MEKARLDKIIAAGGRYSRREVRQLIRQGRVLVDGVPARAPEDKVDPESAEILVNGERLCYRRFTWLMLHKPAGVLSATEDGRGETVLDLLAPELYTTVDCFVGVETISPLTRGMTVCDLENRLGREPNVKVCTAVDPAGFQKLFIDALASANGVPQNPTAAMWLYDEV